MKELYESRSGVQSNEVSDEETEEMTVEMEVTSDKKKIEFGPEEIKEVIQTAGTILGAVTFGGVLVGYISVFVQYKNALARHEKLENLLQHPNARVAAGPQVQRVTEQMKVL